MLEVRATLGRVHPAPMTGPRWHRVVQAPARRWWHVFLHDGGMAALAEQTLVERWSDELEAGVETEVTRALVERLAAVRAAALAGELGVARADGARADGGGRGSWEYRLRVDTLRSDTEPLVRRTLDPALLG